MSVRLDVLYRDDSILTGGRLKVLQSLTRTVSAVCREDRDVRKLYLGKGSGTSAIEAMQARYDEYKQLHGINEVIALYQTSSEHFVLEVETFLEVYFRRKNQDMVARLVNRRGGGAGRPSEQPYHYVYLAIKRLG